jgi:competence ComEA-like helix-hairpin-helix protein
MQMPNINNAERDDLSAVSGINSNMADAIVGYISTHGPIIDIRELENANGIGAATVEKLEARFTASAPVPPQRSLSTERFDGGFGTAAIAEYWAMQPRLIMTVTASTMKARTFMDVLAAQSAFAQSQAALMTRLMARRPAPYLFV